MTSIAFSLRQWPALVRAILLDRLDWERPNRNGARLRQGQRCFTDKFRSWPMVYRVAPGHFHIQAPHRVPHADRLGLIGWTCIGAAIGAVCVAYFKLGIAAAGACAVLLLPVLLVYSLGERRLEIVIRPDGWIGRRRLDGKLQGWVNIVDEPDYQIHVQKHVDDVDAAQGPSPLDTIVNAINARRKPHNLPEMRVPVRDENIHVGATELWISRGPGGDDWIRVAEFEQGRAGYMLRSALLFLIDAADDDRSRQKTRPSDR